MDANQYCKERSAGTKHQRSYLYLKAAALSKNYNGMEFLVLECEILSYIFTAVTVSASAIRIFHSSLCELKQPWPFALISQRPIRNKDLAGGPVWKALPS